MKAFLLIFATLVNVFYIANTLVGFGVEISNMWNVGLGVFLLLSVIFSGYLIINKGTHKRSLSLLSVFVFFISIGSLGWYAFLNYLFLIMG